MKGKVKLWTCSTAVPSLSFLPQWLFEPKVGKFHMIEHSLQALLDQMDEAYGDIILWDTG